MVTIPKVPVGVSTITTLALIVGAVAAFLAEWASSGDPNTGLGGLATALVAILFGGRAAQVVRATPPGGMALDPIPLAPGEAGELPAPTPPRPTDPTG